MLSEITSCEVCGADRLGCALSLGLHPLCDDLVPVNDTRVCQEYPIEILYCENCCTAHQRFQVPRHILFPRSYHYRARSTADVLKGMLEFVESCKRTIGELNGKTVLDIGCNDGSLLNFCRHNGALTIGIEPTDAYIEAQANGHRIFNAFLDEELAESIRIDCGSPNIITMTNVFAHISDLNQVLNSLRLLAGGETVIVIENHYLGSILDRQQFDTFYHEHPRTYSYRSFERIARSIEMHVAKVEFPARYGGNIRVFLTRAGSAVGGSTDYYPTIDENDFQRKFAVLHTHMDKWRRTKRALLCELVQKHGKLRAKAFPGRAAILIKLLGLDERSISAVYEKPGSMKIGHYVPGTRIPILSDDDLCASIDLSAPLLNLAWHISSEIRAYIGQYGYVGEIIDIVDPRDFV